MKFTWVLKAAFKIRNIALLSATVLFAYVIDYPPFVFIGLAGYVYFVLQTLKDSGFQKQCSYKEKLKNIRNLSVECQDFYYKVRKGLDKQVQSKIKSVLKEKNELMDFYNKNCRDSLKQKIVEQALNLVIAYIILISDNHIRYNEITAIDTNEIMDRININGRKLAFLKDAEAINDLKNAINMDEKLVEKVKEEKCELERISARLDFMESAIGMFKHYIISDESSDEMSGEIENTINEATALVNVLGSKRKGRMNL